MPDSTANTTDFASNNLEQEKATIFLQPTDVLELESVEEDKPKSEWSVKESELSSVETWSSQEEEEKDSEEAAPLNQEYYNSSMATAFGQNSRLFHLAALIANATESFSACIFTSTHTKNGIRLSLAAAQTLSENIPEDLAIEANTSLVGWVAKNKKRLILCPFEKEATALGYYSSNEELKSFIALPILSKENKNGQSALLGVIACDSKRSYGYSKLSEKVLEDCAQHASAILELEAALNEQQTNSEIKREQDELSQYKTTLRASSSEQEIISKLKAISQSLVPRDSMVFALHPLREGEAAQLFSADTKQQTETAEASSGLLNRLRGRQSESQESYLMGMVRKNIELSLRRRMKRSNRGVATRQSSPSNDPKNRSFLSVPIKVLDRIVGSINILSQPDSAIDPHTVSKLEEIASVISSELERVRLKKNAFQRVTAEGMLNWEEFVLRAKSSLQTARQSRDSLRLVRIDVAEFLLEVERQLGASAAASADEKFHRTILQAFRLPSATTSLYSSHYLVLGEEAETESALARLKRLVARWDASELSSDLYASEMDLNGLCTRLVRYSSNVLENNEMSSFTQAIERTRRELQPESNILEETNTIHLGVQ